MFALNTPSSLAFSPGWNSRGGQPPPPQQQQQQKGTKLFYDIQRDPPNDNVWSILANTERWISATLQDAQQGGNPLTRKEVSYVCETSQDPALVLANIFRKLKEARLVGESHAQEQEELAGASGMYVCVVLVVIALSSFDCFFPLSFSAVGCIKRLRNDDSQILASVSAFSLSLLFYDPFSGCGFSVPLFLAPQKADYERMTLRQTQVMVIPANDDIMSFLVFDGLINAINQARRNARDYVTDVSLDRLDDRMYGDGGDRDWRYGTYPRFLACRITRKSLFGSLSL